MRCIILHVPVGELPQVKIRVFSAGGGEKMSPKNWKRHSSHAPSTMIVMQHNTNTIQGTPETEVTF